MYEKQVVFWGRKYALKAQAEREEVLKKAHDLVANPQKYNKATSYGAAKYINNLKFDKETGEILYSLTYLNEYDMVKLQHQWYII